MICTIQQAAALAEHDYIVALSGGFDPLHVGHVRYIKGALSLGESMVVIVNGDDFLVKKKGRPFMPVEERMEIINALRGVCYVCPWDGWTVDGALEILRPRVFAKGGDRTGPENIPEWDTCQRLGIRIMTGIGGGKYRSSSAMLEAWRAGTIN